MAVIVLFAAGPAWAVTKDFFFDGCQWRSYALDSGYGTYAETRTVDLNGQCASLDADVKYYEDDSGPFTKYCPNSSRYVEEYNCVKSGVLIFHHESRSRAQSWETDRWQTSGWWG